jgi:AbrB family looped-hinge helix DNA binding protein
MGMQVLVSKTGEIALPVPLRELLGIRPGDQLDATVESGRLVLAKPRVRKRRARIITDPITGLPVLTAGPGAPILTSEMVAEMLVDFP